MIALYTPATGFPGLEAKIAYGLVRMGIEVFGICFLFMKIGKIDEVRYEGN